MVAIAQYFEIRFNKKTTVKDNNQHKVSLWLIPLDQPQCCVDKLKSMLSADEISKSQKFHTLQLCNRFIVRRGCLRHLLGAYLKIAPRNLEFKYGKFGKPKLANAEIEFNTSYSEGLALIGISASQIGLDIEKIKDIPDMDIVARHHFAPIELKKLMNLPKEDKVKGFYRCWTRKEAFIKFDGRGLAIPLDSFAVTLNPDERPRILFTNYGFDNDQRCALQNIEIDSNFSGSVCSDVQFICTIPEVFDPCSV